MKIFGSVLALTIAGPVQAGENGWQDIDLPLTQKQFCRVYESNVEALNIAINSRNDIKMNVNGHTMSRSCVTILVAIYFNKNKVGKEALCFVNCA